MSRRAHRAYDRWRDVDGIHVGVGARVEQTETDARMGALRSRLYRRGQVTSRGATRLVVRFSCRSSRTLRARRISIYRRLSDGMR